MKLLLALAILGGGYYVMLTTGTDLVLGQVQQLQQQYVTIADHADQIAVGQPIGRR